MYLKSTYELTLVLDTEKFGKLLSKVISKGKDHPYRNGEEYVDHTLASKGITVIYRDSQYKKNVKLIVNPVWVVGGDEPDNDIPKLLRKLDAYIGDYFNSKYTLDDFNLTETIFTTDIDVHDHEKVSAYLKVLQRVGKVKGFSPSNDKWLNDDISFCLDGNSNGITFLTYDLEGLFREQLKEAEHGRKQLKSAIKKSEGIIRVEVRLTEPKAIKDYTDETITSKQIKDLSKEREKIFLETFMRVVPFGDFYKKDKAVEIIRKEVTEQRLRRRMLRLVALVPEKKSLLLAQKALNYRRIEDVMEAFAAIDLSPVTISKRNDVKKLDNLYKYM